MTRSTIFKLSIVLVCLDQLFKYWVMNNLFQLESRTLLPGLFDLTYATNTGIAFSFLKEKPSLLTALISLIMVLLILYVWKEASSMPRLQNIGLAFIVGGGFSNLLDRYMHGHVIDYINPIFIDFAIFNFADMCLNIGVFLLLWAMFSSKAEA